MLNTDYTHTQSRSETVKKITPKISFVKFYVWLINFEGIEILRISKNFILCVKKIQGYFNLCRDSEDAICIFFVFLIVVKPIEQEVCLFNTYHSVL